MWRRTLTGRHGGGRADPVGGLKEGGEGDQTISTGGGGKRRGNAKNQSAQFLKRKNMEEKVQGESGGEGTRGGGKMEQNQGDECRR